MNFSIECHAGSIEDHVWRIVLGEFSGAYVRFDAPFRKIPSKETGAVPANSTGQQSARVFLQPRLGASYL
ncbi:hypothetical protein KO02_13095 [Sphingobacterium sp. ML3W]|uniref:hypothetical protein n=1 Tax=Sphingobacterium sp. ML3W TaxID=1538644 RepID=UPI0004F790CF|nr:hypothetical protein [Sphingobacterium sp. ML3W]AIM37523.1 hypothetical protein KO02_13095 [Sphingobacterium sp. ML3W]